MRVAFTMKLKPGALAEYTKKHDEIWPELVDEIEKAGIASITTFEADPVLFLVSEVSDPEAWDRLWATELHLKWAEVMRPFMHIDDQGIVESTELNEIFHLETKAK